MTLSLDKCFAVVDSILSCCFHTKFSLDPRWWNTRNGGGTNHYIKVNFELECFFLNTLTVVVYHWQIP